MLTPDYLDHIPDRVVELYSELEIRILEDMARRIVKMDKLTDTAQWQMWKLEQIGMEREFIQYHLERLTGKTQGEINGLLEEAGEKALYFDDQIYREAGLFPKSIQNSEALQRVINAGLKKTMRLFQNLTGTTANTATRQFENALDTAYMDVISGAFSYQEAIKKAVKTLSGSGIDSIQYPSGHVDKMDVAVRRAVLTGVNQTAAEIQIARADEMECDLVETTAHLGARPDHAVWQGKVFSRSGKSKKFPDFISSTGYGTGAGLCGWNCRHSFFPFFEGISEKAYSRQELSEIKRQSVTYNGKKLTYYEATQEQRYIERKIRKWKREYMALDAGGLDTSEASSRLSMWRARQKDFLEKTGLAEDNFRSQVEGFGRSQAAKAKNIAEKNYQNWLKDIGAKNSSPKTLAKYYQEKYNNTPTYELLKKYAKDVESGWVSPNVGFAQYKKVFQFIEENLVGRKTSNGILIKGQTGHFIQRVCGTMVDPEKLQKELKIVRRSGVEIEDVLEALTNGAVRPVKYTHGKPSQLFYNEKCAVSVNPDTGILIQCNK
jgi:hypothetical protein